MAKNKISDNGILIIAANNFRLQERNRNEAMNKLIDLIKKACERPKIRRKTSPTLSSKENRILKKKKNSFNKKIRKISINDEQNN